MKNFFLVVSVGLLISFGTGCGSPEQDLKMVCDEFTTFSEQVESGEGEYGELEPNLRQRTLAKNITSKLRSSEISDAWEVLEVTPPEKRYAVLEAAAQTTGHEGWQCPAIKETWAPSEPTP